MTAEDLIQLRKREILDNPNNKALYIQFYKAFFGSAPSCANCSFNSDFRKFKNKVLCIEAEKSVHLKQSKTIIMNNFKLKKGFSSTIFSYPDKDGRMKRSYGKDLTNEFVADLLKVTKSKYKDYFEELPTAQPKQVKGFEDDEPKADKPKVEKRNVKSKGKKSSK